jgi:hypothetical protein
VITINNFNKLTALLLMTVSSNAIADVEFNKLGFSDSKGHEYASLKITNFISEKDVTKFKQYINQIHKQHLRLERDSVELASKGGILFAAGDIGKIVRKEHFSTYVSEDSKCASSCVLILVSGICRMALGDVLVHRPMEVPSDKNEHRLAEQDKKYLLHYMDEMEVPPAMAWTAITTPYWMISPLSDADKDYYGFYYPTIEEQDVRTNIAAKKLKLTKFEVMAKLSDRYRELNEGLSDDDPKHHLSCSEQLFLGD